jgi:transcriptional regulator with XRE-family HTH domain
MVNNKIGEMRTHKLTGLNGRSCTVKDIARLAGVSTATVSRVLNGAENVSRKTRAIVLSSISRLQYRPNAYAAELGRANGGIPRKRRIRVSASSGTGAKPVSDSGAGARGKRGKASRLLFLEDEGARLRQLVNDLSLDLETLRSIAQ